MSSDLNTSQFAPMSTNTNYSRWLTEEVFKLIDIVQRDEAIYNPRHKYYFCRPYVENFWREVDQRLEKNPGASLAKWTNLRISFRREYTNYVEEKVPPCWSYFDRMFFLHPYLRKKHQPPKSLDTQVQDALAHLSNLSNRMQRERAVTTCTPTAADTAASSSRIHPNASAGPSSAQQSPQPQQLDSYLDYFDDQEHNNSELEDIIDEEQRARFPNPLDHDIKSECEDDYDDDEREEDEMRKTVYDSLATTVASSTCVGTSLPVEKRNAQPLQSQPQPHKMQINRVQMRAYHEEAFPLRPRSQEHHQSSVGTAVSAANMQMHSNISFVRPTFTKPVDMVSTTNPSNAVTSISSAITTSSAYLAPRHASHHQPPQRLEATTSTLATGIVGSSGAVEQCDCKSDPDAMFLMSLLPDIQKLNGRDRGKIKIAFQNILQDYLYPD
ncbi:uncharacterized protein LOC115623670 [Scaptodrosophila lebanonensis]|uniref:Uncharacterized protein LOC115623670 n=1 Tax=Drosophila lebanonensis TaxID=7225 RepID=A0A6J2TAZ1_DROLE|nr:uncharacterized protein LOC115623670 [Scaptodrosophila lebanonensis]